MSRARDLADSADLNFDDGTLVIDSGNNRVGIGTASPAQLLHVNGDTRVTGLFYGSDGTAGSPSIRFYNASTGIYHPGADALGFVASASERMRIDSSGNVGIGTTSPSKSLQVQSSSSENGRTLRLAYDGTYYADIAQLGAGGVAYRAFGGLQHIFEINGSEAMRIDSSRRLLIGASSTIANGNANELELTNPSGSGVVGMTFNVNSGSANTGNIYWRSTASNNAIQISGDPISNYLAFATSGTEAARIDSSGRLLVGLTSANADAGVTIRPEGLVRSAKNGPSGQFDRISTDGVILDFRKDNSTVGSISTYGSSVVIGGGDCGVRFIDATNSIAPANVSGNTDIDDSINLGYSSRRFKNLYLSGGVYLGGTGSANKLEDYEEGTWTPSLISAGSPSYTRQEGVYVKTGDLVTCTFRLTYSGASNTSSSRLEGLPFSSADNIKNRLGWVTLNTNVGSLSAVSPTGASTTAVYAVQIASNSSNDIYGVITLNV